MSKTIIYLSAGFLALFILFTPIDSDARDKTRAPIGHVVAVEGQAFLIGEGEPLRLKNDTPIYLNSHIETKDKTRVVILFIDDSQIRLGSNASLTIDKYVYDPYPEASEDSKSNEAQYSVLRGAFEYISGLLAKPFDSKVKVKAEHGSIGIRGTRFWGGPLEEAEYAVYVKEGAVEFTSEPSRRVYIPGGTGIYVRDVNSPLPEAEKWQDYRIEKANEKVAFFTIARENLLKRIRVHQERNIKSRRELWRNLHPRLPVPWGATGTGPGEEGFSDEMRDQKRRHRERIQRHDQRIRQ